MNNFVVQPAVNYLKLYREQSVKALQADVENVASLPKIQAAFRELTGWAMKYLRGAKASRSDEAAWAVPVEPGAGVPSGRLALAAQRTPSSEVAVPVPVAEMAGAVADMLTELLKTQQALWQREAELAAGVPVVFRESDQRHFASRLHAVLQGGAEAVGCHAAALYLLDESTSHLKLRSCWGLPRERLTEPARPLQGALADLEAMLGHAVVLEDTGLYQQWNPPEQFAAAVCVPIASASTILGTLWFFCNSRRDFNDRETNIVEVIAGRIAAELEREMLVQEGAAGAALRRDMAAAERFQRNLLPITPPVLNGWELAGWTSQAGPVGGCFHDWFTLTDGLVGIVLGCAAGHGLESAMAAAALRTAFRAHGLHQPNTDLLLRESHQTLWTGSAGDLSASAFCGMIDTVGRRIRFSTAGELVILRLRANGWESLGFASTALGKGPELTADQIECDLESGEMLLVLNRVLPSNGAAGNSPIGGLAEELLAYRAGSAKEMASRLRDRVESLREKAPQDGVSFLIVKRSNP